MNVHFAEYVRRYLGDKPGLTKPQRQAAYECARRDLKDHYWDRGYSRSEWEAANDVLNETIAAIEGAYEPALHERIGSFLSDVIDSINAKFGFLAGAISFANDFIKPILDLTQPVMIGSGILAVGLLGLSRTLPTKRRLVLHAAGFCGLLCLCSGVWFGLQNYIPGAQASGVLAQVAPGAGDLQNAMLVSLGRIENQTKRVGDLLEDSARREREQEEAFKRQEAKRLAEIRKKIEAFGFSVDAIGYAAAVIAGENGLTSDFEQLGIKHSRDAVLTALRTLEDKEKVRRLIQSVVSEGRSDAAVRPIFLALRSAKQNLETAFQNSRAHEVICVPKADAIVLATATLKSVCATTDAEFAGKFIDYYYAYWPDVNTGMSLAVKDYLLRRPEELPLVKVRTLQFSKLPRCKYFQGTASFWLYPEATANFDAGAIEFPERTGAWNANSIEIRFEDKEARPALVRRCNRNDNLVRADQQCRAEVIVASGCERIGTTILKVVGSPAPNGAHAVDGDATLADGKLSAADVRRELIGKNVEHNGMLTLSYAPNGTFDGGDGRFGTNGTYRIEADGRVCWRNNRGFSGCFQYFRQGGVLQVRRNDSTSHDMIGPVKITSR